MGEADRLTDSPTRNQLWRACTIGGRVGRSPRGRRVKCPSLVSPLKRWTTAEAWDWFLAQINGDA